MDSFELMDNYPPLRLDSEKKGRDRCCNCIVITIVKLVFYQAMDVESIASYHTGT
jgi:hypothetical protein